MLSLGKVRFLIEKVEFLDLVEKSGHEKGPGFSEAFSAEKWCLLTIRDVTLAKAGVQTKPVLFYPFDKAPAYAKNFDGQAGQAWIPDRVGDDEWRCCMFI